ncbi:PAS domain-containing hybrid sensor histidine kinase/response regulator [Sphingomonas oligophenolica]|nr:PAS domain-containing protein [Sphingomonas oligophenolica]
MTTVAPFLAGGGEIGALMRSRDWSSHPLGDLGGWPPSLRTIVALMLSSRFPMFVAWGDELSFLYNDAYADILGAKHPDALGGRFADIWHEIWSDISPLIDAALAGEASYRENLPLVMHRKGYDEPTWFTFSYSPVVGHDGAIAGMYCVCTETTGQVIAEKRRAADSRRLRDLMQEMPAFIAVMTGPEHRFAYVNDAYVAITGSRDYIGRPIRDVLPELADQGLFELVDRVYANGERQVEHAAPVWFAHEDEPRFIDFLCAPMVGHDDGAITGIFVSGYDVTERLRAERAVRDSEAYTRLLLDSTAEGFYAVDRDGVTTLCNDAFISMLGFASKDEAIGRKLHDIVHHSHPDGSTYAASDCPIYLAASAGTPAFVSGERFFRLDGSSFPVDYRAEPVMRHGEVVGAICTFVDTSEREQAQADLAQQARVLETLNRTGAALAGELDLDRLIKRVTDAGLELTGAQFGAFFYNVLDSEGESYMLYALSGAERAAFDGFGMPRATAIFQPTFQGNGIIRSDDIMTDARYGKTAPHFGMPKGHLPVRSYLAVPVISRSGEVIGGLFYGHEDPAVFAERHEQLIAGIAGQAAIGVDNARLFQSTQRLNDTLEERVRERTAELEQAQEALRQSQKMEAVGQLTGGIAHDFNNMLAVVIGSLDLLGRRIGDGDARQRRYIDAAADGARRAALLTQRLLAFSRQQPLKPEAIRVNQLVSGMSDLLRRSLGSDVLLETVLAAGAWPVHADPNQLENVILNLAVNARDAMPEGGRLTIETQNAHLDARYVAHHPGLTPGQYALIAVTDTGAGMPDDVIAKAFDPFFTTKEVGKGTGLGLSQVYGFVKQSGGHVKIYSEIDHGTTIKIYLPRLIGDTEEAAPDVFSQDVPLGDGREVVLVVEDEPSVRAFSVDALTELGYRVLEADGAGAALRLLDAHPEIDLLFTDVVMPEMNGAKLAEEVRVRRPDLKILFTTGYTRNAVVHNGVLDAGVNLIGKPFTVDELAARVREVLDIVPTGVAARDAGGAGSAD